LDKKNIFRKYENVIYIFYGHKFVWALKWVYYMYVYHK
jgi:hypothetical protein